MKGTRKKKRSARATGRPAPEGRRPTAQAIVPSAPAMLGDAVKARERQHAHQEITPGEDPKTQIRLSYLAALDPWRQTTARDVEWLLKLAALTGRRLVISDNQALNNSGLHVLLRRPDVFSFLSRPDYDGGPPLCIALREGTHHFENVAERLVLNREQPAIFPWMSSAQQDRLDAAYIQRQASTVDPLFDIAGKQFRDHIDRLEKLRDSNARSTLAWTGLESNYVQAASTAVQRFRDATLKEGLPSRSRDQAICTCDLLLTQIQRGVGINRSNLYRLVAHAGLDSATQLAIQLKCLDEPYHNNFAAMSGCHTTITGREYRDAEVAPRMAAIADKLGRLRSADIFEISEFPLLLNQVPFARISALRGSPVFLELLEKLTIVADEQRARVIVDLLNIISAEFAKEPKGLRKLTHLRLHVLLPPRELANELASAGLTLSDVVAFLSKATGFVVGETVGWLVGVFGVGGALGTGAAMIVEQVARHAYEKPKKHREFQEVLQFLASASHPSGSTISDSVNGSDT